MQDKKMKKHLNENKRIYITGGITSVVVAGFTYFIVREHYVAVLRVANEEKTIDIRPAVRSLSFFNNRPNTEIVTVIHNGYRGHPGFIVRNLETRLTFSSQREAAKHFGISPSILSSHLNGKFQDACGLHFERIFVEA